ncbi:hypothetical protein BABINDRAFT_159260 [Babjeviella inositovora NRRL Y-12698]|uniref:Uncharacterized protein n=1 Tax=Babjeviella inositovora NRRL Y-12698 TaxID=984486 RepID=A0A1E3QYN8_9ASCO|nr:uncharacterized protein BABINDRAFT_159260 [Babjeviella inositovora NRRL Y-12698]ODQ82746.1 hypothetical protein BABINDRAFT_159260 [Babjeviella inositovora NRRL Y-12698]
MTLNANVYGTVLIFFMTFHAKIFFLVWHLWTPEFKTPASLSPATDGPNADNLSKKIPAALYGPKNAKEFKNDWWCW